MKTKTAPAVKSRKAIAALIIKAIDSLSEAKDFGKNPTDGKSIEQLGSAESGSPKIDQGSGGGGKLNSGGGPTQSQLEERPDPIEESMEYSPSAPGPVPGPTPGPKSAPAPAPAAIAEFKSKI